MSPKRIIIVSTMAVAIAVGVVWNEETNASAIGDKYSTCCKFKGADQTAQDAAAQDQLKQALADASDEEIYDALYNGKSLADIAASNDADVQNVIDLQVAELTEQLDMRLASGSLSPDAYEAYISEVSEIITQSVYGGAVPSGST